MTHAAGSSSRRHDSLVVAGSRAEVASAAFDYRYIITVPPLRPKRHVKPKAAVIFGGGFFVALVLGLFAAFFADLMSRRVLESWQVQESSGLPVLGTVKEVAQLAERFGFST